MSQDDDVPFTCPGCGGFDYEGGFVDIHETYATQECQCTECETTFTCVFKLIDRIVRNGPVNLGFRENST